MGRRSARLRGAAVAEHLLDADGEIAQRVREIVGDDLPVGATFELHANLSERVIEALTVANVYQTNPHVDARAQALACVDLVVRCARREIHPVMAFVPIPLVVSIARQDTSEEPMSRLIDAAHTLSCRQGMLSVSAVQGFPYADVPQMGMSCLAVHGSDADEAETAARELAAAVWVSRAELQTVGITVEEALNPVQRADEVRSFYWTSETTSVVALPETPLLSWKLPCAVGCLHLCRPYGTRQCR